MGCFAKGCLTFIIIGFILIAGVCGTAWFFYHKVATNLLSNAPSDVRIEAPTEAQYQAAEQAHTQLTEAIRTKKETTIAFTGPDLNALLVRDPDFEFLRNRGRIAIANSALTLDLSAPLDVLPWPGMNGRWFNGTIRFKFSYNDGMFSSELLSAEAGGHQFPTSFLSGFNSSFNRTMNQSFHEELDRNETAAKFWKQIKSMTLEGDKLLVTTQAD